MLFYAMYGHLFYAVAAAFNQVLLLYVATVGLSLYALLFSVPRLDLAQRGDAMGGRAARIVAIACTSAVAIGLGLLWVGISLSYLFTKDVPQLIVNSAHPNRPVPLATSSGSHSPVPILATPLVANIRGRALEEVGYRWPLWSPLAYSSRPCWPSMAGSSNASQTTRTRRRMKPSDTTLVGVR